MHTNIQKRFQRLLLLATLSVTGLVDAASIRVEWSNTAGAELLTIGGSPLSSGSTDPGDGAILQLGYYTIGTPSNPFSGAWRPLTGPGSNRPFGSAIGDKGIELPGRFNLSNTYQTPAPTEIFPSPAAPLVVRFYNSSDFSSTSHFNAVSNELGSWNWISPTDPQTILNLTLSDPGLVWQGGPDSAFRTTIPIPEPVSGLLVAVAGGLGLLRRRESLFRPVPSSRR